MDASKATNEIKRAGPPSLPLPQQSSESLGKTKVDDQVVYGCKSSDSQVGKEEVLRAMKQLLKKNESMTMRELRKSVRSKLTGMPKKTIKHIIKGTLKESKKFHLDGKTVTLRTAS